jgi:hypothetical protein
MKLNDKDIIGIRFVGMEAGFVGADGIVILRNGDMLEVNEAANGLQRTDENRKYVASPAEIQRLIEMFPLEFKVEYLDEETVPVTPAKAKKVEKPEKE